MHAGLQAHSGPVTPLSSSLPDPYSKLQLIGFPFPASHSYITLPFWPCSFLYLPLSCSSALYSLKAKLNLLARISLLLSPHCGLFQMPLAAVPHIYNKTFLSNLPGNGHVHTLFPDKIKTMAQELSLIHCPFPPLQLYLRMTYSTELLT